MSIQTMAWIRLRIASAPLWPTISMQDLARTNRAAGTTLNLASAATGFNPGTVSSSSLTPTTFRGRNFGFFQLGVAAASYTVDFWGVNEDAEYHEAGNSGEAEALKSVRLVPTRGGGAA